MERENGRESACPPPAASGEGGRAVFVSYAREDTEAARRIADALRAFGVEVWFDQSELRGGDAWDQKIRGQIKDSTLFVPVVSAHTESRGEGYFRLEWKLADERTHLMAKGVPFLVPVVVDRTGEGEAMVPDSFRAVQWTRLPGGVPTPEFVAQVKRLLETPRRSAAKKAGSAGAGPPAATVASKPRSPRAMIAVVAVVAVSVAAFFVLRPGAKVLGQSNAAVAGAINNDKSIAVLPFENISDDKENTAFFADGMHEDILTNLANIRELRVVSRTSVMDYRGTKKKIPEIARELGVAYILEGSVRRSGSQVRITGQLIRAANDEHLWAKSYDRELTPKEMFAIQARLATEIAGALQAAISPATKKLLEHRPTENLAAYDLYLKARTIGRIGYESQKKREQLLQAAVALDPDFALAWAELAITLGYQYRDVDRTPARLAQADLAMARAAKLAPGAPGTILAQGYHAYLAHRDYARAIAEFGNLIRLQPSNAEVMVAIAIIQRRQGRWIDSLASYRKAEKLEPGSRVILFDFTTLLRAGRRWGEALAACGQMVALRPDHFGPTWFMAATDFAATGATHVADEWLAALTAAEREQPGAVYLRKWRANITGDFLEWKRLDARQPYVVDEETWPLWGTPWDQALNAAMAFAAKGDMAGARLRLANWPVELKARFQADPENAHLCSALAQMEALLGEKTEALRHAKKSVELIPETLDALTGPRLSRGAAVVFAWTGDKDKALAELARLVRIPFGIPSVHTLRVDASFGPLRGDPRFEALLNDPKNNEPLCHCFLLC